MKVIGVLTEDFEVYYDLVQALKARDVPFLSLSFGERIPASVGVVLTTEPEAARIVGTPVVVVREARDAVEEAERVLSGARVFRRVIVGIDPGEKPGLAVIGDGRVLATRQVRVPEDVAEVVDHMRRTIPTELFTVRVGHGAPTYRDRILLALQRLAGRVRVEVVDETKSTPTPHRSAEERDTAAAKAIALARGVAAGPVGRIRPSDGELRDIQRKSRVASSGRVTISRGLARRVALGEMALDEAIREQQGHSGAASPG